MTIRARLLLLVLGAVLIPAIMLGVRHYQARQIEIDAAAHRLALEAQEVARALAAKIQGTAQLQFGLARASDLGVRDKAACSAFLSEVLAKQPQYTGILTIDPDGQLFCDSLRTGRVLDLRDRQYYKQALLTTDAVVLEPVFGRLTGIAVLQIAFPVRNSSQDLQFVLLASLNLNEFLKEQATHLPPGIEFLLVDANATMMASSADGRRDILGKSIADSDLFRFAKSNPGGKQELVGLDGLTQVWAVADSELTRRAGLYVLVGQSKKELAAFADRRLIEDLSTLGVLTLVLLLGVWLVAEVSIRSQIGRIAAVAKRLGAGDLSARLSPPYPSGELGSLMTVFNNSADSLEQQRRDIDNLNQKFRASLIDAEKHLTRTRQFQDILDHAPVTVTVKARDGRIIFANREFQRRLEQAPEGFFKHPRREDGTSENLTGKTLHELFPADFADRLTELDEEVFANKTVVQRELISPEPKTYLSTKFPLIDANGNVEAVGSISLDISDSKAAQTINLRIFEKSQDVILITDSKGALVRVSPSTFAVLGYRPHEMEGRNAIEFIHPGDLDRTREEMRQARRGKVTRNFETRYLHKDGHTVRLNWTGVWVDEEGQHFFIGQDMTEREKLEQELRQSQKMEALGQLTGGLAHDYNNLLTVILGNAELLMESLQGQPRLLDLAQATVDAADRSAVLTQRLLAFGRRQDLNAEPTDINELINGMLGLIRVTVGEQFKLDLALGDDPWTLNVDRSQLETTILNLVVNARDAMGGSGTLRIETAKASFDEEAASISPDLRIGSFMVLTIADTGKGMTPEIRARVFEPFFTTKEMGKGTGLGLSMVYGFVKQSGGHITVYSEPGVGTSVKLYFPPVDGDAIAYVPAQELENGLLAGTESVLLVEDDPLVRENTERQLISLGYKVVSAGTGKEALEHFNTGFRPALLLTDVIMTGGMNGRELADKLLALDAVLRVLFMSGYTSGVLADSSGIILEGTHFLGKPFRRSQLAKAVRETLDSAPIH